MKLKVLRSGYNMILSSIAILWIALIIYLILMVIAFIFDVKWLYAVAGLLFFIPITQISEPFIVSVSVVAVLTHAVLGLYEKQESGF